ncbi:hypothetical protein RDWZM_002592 [Blomia tropicalis]|uniref:Uncharacterized protein n=1 Tax=Blomia tropicalis TaxID=40697 RepID=A0A9Q0ME87_BLOTA|nr:hypothetical protein BLOT_001588 [Blomia tropicalis]KAJ6224047.1 hypothetical protein RDWZM_002592 [Blomia tropicalis]
MNRSKWEMSIKQLRTYQVFIVAIVIILFGCHALDAAIISNSAINGFTRITSSSSSLRGRNLNYDSIDYKIDETNRIECSNDTMKRDFGTSCLKTTIRKNPGRIVPSTRHFSVKPMMYSNGGLRRKSGVKSPATKARDLFTSRGYSSVHPIVKSSKRVESTELDPRIESTTESSSYGVDDEWRQTDLVEPIIPIGSIGSNSPPSNNNGQKIPFRPNRPPQFVEELEMLASLKRSLGILCAQALNLKQRTILLYREARRRKLHFFDALLVKTHRFISEKLDETRNAIADIDQAIQQIRHHNEVMAFNQLRRTFYYRSGGGRSFQMRRRPSSMRRRSDQSTTTTSTTSTIDQRELDQLIIDALNHAKRMMTIVRELNEALDEFEEQFNLPRFEPNNIDDNSLDMQIEHNFR